MAETRTLTIGTDDDGRRLDRVLRKHLGGLPLSALHRLIRKGAVRLDGRRVDADARVARGSVLTLPAEIGGEERAARPAAPSAPLDIAYENDRLLIVVKPAGQVTHGEGGLDRDVLAYLSGKLPPSLSFSPGPLHRLDRGTSGLVAFSKSLDGARRFSAAVAERRIGKRYIAVLGGALAGPERWEDRLERDRAHRAAAIASDGEGAAADTAAYPLVRAGSATLALLQLGSGRTHQIRVQAAARGHALLGDGAYGGAALAGGFLLHAYELSDESEPKEADLLPPLLTAPPPERFLAFVAARFGPAWAEKLAEALPCARLLDAIL